MSEWTDFNDAKLQVDKIALIPKDTICKVRIDIIPGGYDNIEVEWEGGWATRSERTDSAYLSCEYTILDGKYDQQKISGLIGLYSPKGPKWGERGRSFIRAILNSAYGLMPNDFSPAAIQKRKINSLGDLNGLEFIVQIGIEKNQNSDWINNIKQVIEPNHKRYVLPTDKSVPF
jgi:hypothetical protein